MNPYRCDKTSQYDKYANMIGELYDADDTEIFELTGCLSRCDKFRYTVKEHRPLQQTRKAWTNNTLDLAFWFLSGEHEVRQQVIPLDVDVDDELTKACLIAVHHL